MDRDRAWASGVGIGSIGNTIQPLFTGLRARHPSNDFRQEFVQQAAAHLAALQRLLDPPIQW